MTQIDGPALPTAIPRLKETIERIETRPLKGRVTRAVGTVIHAVIPDVRIGELCILEEPRRRWSLHAEVVGLSGETALLTPIGDLKGLSSRTEVVSTGRMIEAPVGDALLGRVIDSRGQPLDARGPVETTTMRPLHAMAPNPVARTLIERPLKLGLRVLDGLLTCGEG